MSCVKLTGKTDFGKIKDENKHRTVGKFTKFCVGSIVLYGSETCALKKKEERYMENF